MSDLTPLVEDSPAAFRFFDHLSDLKVMVYDCPWNHKVKLPGENYIRCADWEMIRKNIAFLPRLV